MQQVLRGYVLTTDDARATEIALRSGVLHETSPSTEIVSRPGPILRGGIERVNALIELFPRGCHFSREEIIELSAILRRAEKSTVEDTIDSPTDESANTIPHYLGSLHSDPNEEYPLAGTSSIPEDLPSSPKSGHRKTSMHSERTTKTIFRSSIDAPADLTSVDDPGISNLMRCTVYPNYSPLTP